MSRTVTGLTTHLAQTSQTRCTMLLMELRNGETIGVTDHDEPITYNLTEAGLGSVAYSVGTGIAPSDVVLTIGLDASNFEVTGPVGGLVTRPMLTGGKFDRATVWLFQLNWVLPGAGKIPLTKGNVTEVRIEGGRFIFQVRSEQDKLNQVIGRLITPYCDADFGDARCGVTPESIVGTVSAVTSVQQFTVTFAGAYADDYFNFGKVEPLTGDLVGIPPVEIFDWTSAGVVTLFTELPAVPTIGDTFTIKRGCSKLWKSADASIPTCVSYDNAINFRGFPFMPGSDQILRYPVPGNAGA